MKNRVYLYENGELTQSERGIVREYPVQLHVNGREIATLIASPHDLMFLVAGFLRLQGFVESAEDFHMLSVCEDFGIANVRIRKELPEKLRPVLTSGCGTGVTFSFDFDRDMLPLPPGRVLPAVLCTLMEEVARRAESYKLYGGIHSAAVGDAEGNVILFAEDIGRHNTIDRIAGKALFLGTDLRGALLVTSGRISAELVIKAARLGIPVIASRTSPTDMAVSIAERAGITLVGYVRGRRFIVYSGADRLCG